MPDLTALKRKKDEAYIIFCKLADEHTNSELYKRYIESYHNYEEAHREYHRGISALLSGS